MNRIHRLLIILIFPLLSSCETLTLIANTIPTFAGSQGPVGNVSDLDYKATIGITVDVKIFDDAEIILAFATSEDELRSINSVKVFPECTVDGTSRHCQTRIPSALDMGMPVFNKGPGFTIADTVYSEFSVGDIVFFQWLVEYGDAGEVAESSVRQFRIMSPPSCDVDAVGLNTGVGCDPQRACRNITLTVLGIPGNQVAPRCLIPEPDEN